MARCSPMVALVIDGGNAYAQQRRRRRTASTPRRRQGRRSWPACWSACRSATGGQERHRPTAAANDITTVESAEYTDLAGDMLTTLGAVTRPGDGRQVGSATAARRSRPAPRASRSAAAANSTPTSAASSACRNGRPRRRRPPSPASPRISGFGGLVPLTFPILLTQCESGGGSNKIFFPDDGIVDPPDNPAFGTSWPFGPNNRIAIPLCSNGPGNVGWIDWDSGGGGVAQLTKWILGPDPEPADLDAPLVRGHGNGWQDGARRPDGHPGGDGHHDPDLPCRGRQSGDAGQRGAHRHVRRGARQSEGCDRRLPSGRRRRERPGLVLPRDVRHVPPRALVHPGDASGRMQ